MARTVRQPQPEGAESLRRARLITRQARRARERYEELIAARNDAIADANKEGASYGLIAAETDLSRGTIQAIVEAAR